MRQGVRTASVELLSPDTEPPSSWRGLWSRQALCARIVWHGVRLLERDKRFEDAHKPEHSSLATLETIECDLVQN